MTDVTPSVDLTFFPRINYLKNFNTRAIRRDFNGRIFGPYGIAPIDFFPEVDGSTCLNEETFPLDLGPAVATTPTSVIDLRNDCGTASVIDLNQSQPQSQSLPTGAVTISGTPEEDQTLFAVTSTIADPNGLGTFSYQWSADGSAVSGATSNSYLLTQADVSKAFTVTVSYTDGGGTLESLTSAATSAVVNVNDPPVGTVTITGTTTQGETLTASASITDEDGIGTFSYQWKADGVAISGATNTTYVLTAAEAGKQITCTVSYTDGQGTAESLTSAATAAVVGLNNPPTGNVVITGLVTYGKTLTADTSGIADADGLGAFSYQWSADSTAISGATSSTYTLTQAEVGKAITVTVSYTDGQGTAESLTSAATAAVVVEQIQYTISNSGTTFTLRSSGTVDFNVDWGDGSSLTSQTSNALAHTYATAGTYTIKVTLNSGVYRPYYTSSSDGNQITSIAIGTGNSSLGTSLQNAFRYTRNMNQYTQASSATSGVSNFRYTWKDCRGLTSFPEIDFSSATNFTSTWQGCNGLTSFPALPASKRWVNATNFLSAWQNCTSLATFGPNQFDSQGAMVGYAFSYAWYNCALTAQSIENILTSLDTNGAQNITLGINGGTNAGKTTWSSAANTAYTNLINKGWTIFYNS